MGNEADSGTGLIDANVKVEAKASDLLGLGAAANTRAGEQIATAVSSGLGRFATAAGLLLFGDRLTRIEANRLTTLAKAHGEAQLIEAEYAAQLRERAGVRVLNEECRRQHYIEAATREAILIADQRNSEGPPAEVDEEFALTWMEGVKDAHAESVRTMWARLLASQTVIDGPRVRGPSLALLKTLDAELAGHFKNFATFLVTYGAFPYEGGLEPQPLNPADLQYLEELGFIFQANFKSWNLRELKISRRGKQFVAAHGHYMLSQRALELAIGIFGERPFEEGLKGCQPSIDEEVLTYFKLITSVASGTASFSPKGVILTLPGSVGGQIFEIEIDPSNENPQARSISGLEAEINEAAPLINTRRLKILSAVIERFGYTAARKVPPRDDD